MELDPILKVWEVLVQIDIVVIKSSGRFSGAGAFFGLGSGKSVRVEAWKQTYICCVNNPTNPIILKK
jgi:hypothetical protein